MIILKSKDIKILESIKNRNEDIEVVETFKLVIVLLYYY